MPSGTAAVAGALIQSAKYNSVNTDLESDANTARPLVAGGTGATTAADARTNIGVDAAQSSSTKSANYTAVAGDKNSIIRFSAAATLSLTAAATLGANWYVTVMADGGAVGVDPNASETINGATTIVIPLGFSATILCDGTLFRTVYLAPIAEAGLATAIRNYLSGFTLSNNGTDPTNDINIAAGSCMDSTNSYSIVLTSAITKRLDALWTVGTDQGGLDTGAAANTWYHVYAIKRLDTGVSDVIFSTSASAPTLPTSYTIYRRLGSFQRKSGSIVSFDQFGDEFLLDVPVLDVDATQGTTANLRALASVPSGVTVEAKIRVRGNNSGSWSLLLTSPDVADQAPNGVDAPLVDIAGNATADRITMSVRTNTSQQIRTRASDSGTDLKIVTYGWIDTRGK